MSSLVEALVVAAKLTAIVVGVVVVVVVVSTIVIVIVVTTTASVVVTSATVVVVATATSATAATATSVVGVNTVLAKGLQVELALLTTALVASHIVIGTLDSLLSCRGNVVKERRGLVVKLVLLASRRNDRRWGISNFLGQRLLRKFGVALSKVKLT